MNTDDSIIVASVLIAGMTEREMMETRNSLLKYMKIFCLKPEDENSLYVLKIHTKNNLPIMSLFLETGYWELYAESHNEWEFSMISAQPNIWAEEH